MFYGDSFAVADDVVGHEMTHGIIDQYSELFYWGQSGAMNESIADIMGEVVDHRAAAGRRRCGLEAVRGPADRRHPGHEGPDVDRTTRTR